MEPPIKINLESCCCPPFMRGTIFRRQGDNVWVVMGTDPLKGKVQLQLFRMDKPVLENDNESTD